MRRLPGAFALLFALTATAAASGPDRLYRQKWQVPGQTGLETIMLVSFTGRGGQVQPEFHGWASSSSQTVPPSRVTPATRTGDTLAFSAFFPALALGADAPPDTEVALHFSLAPGPDGAWQGPVTRDGQTVGTTRFESVGEDRAILAELRRFAEAYAVEIAVTQANITALSQQVDFYNRMVEEDRRSGTPPSPTHNQMFRDMTQRSLFAEHTRLQALQMESTMLHDRTMQLEAALGAGPAR